MDTLLVSGDFQKDSRGKLITVTDEQELLQRALIRLMVKKGSFPYDTALGSELYKLRRSDTALMNRTALGYVQDALYPMTALTVGDVACVYSPDLDSVLVKIELIIKHNPYALEVQIS